MFSVVRSFISPAPDKKIYLTPSSAIPYFTLGIASIPLTSGGLMHQPEPRDLFPGALEMMILQTLKRQPLHGYALAQHIKRASNDLLQVEEGSLYPALQRLLKARLLFAEWTTSATNRRVRVYKVTPAGLKHLQTQVSSFEQMLEGITRVLSPVKP